MTVVTRPAEVRIVQDPLCKKETDIRSTHPDPELGDRTPRPVHAAGKASPLKSADKHGIEVGDDLCAQIRAPSSVCRTPGAAVDAKIRPVFRA